LAYITVYKKILVGRLPAKRITASLKVSKPFCGNMGDNKKVDNDVNDTIEFKYTFSHYIKIHGITPQRRHHTSMQGVRINDKGRYNYGF
jgi:hypothetical protein